MSVHPQPLTLPVGVYVHLPFCASRCIYCDFHSQTNLSLRDAYVEAIDREIRARAPQWRGLPASTVYLGGGTPTQLTTAQLQRIFSALQGVGGWVADAEITLEANPDDLSPERVSEMQSLPVNRISVGVQTLDNQRLRFLRRRHTAEQAVQAVRQLQAGGYDNVSIDLIFAFPGQTLAQWEMDLEGALSLGVPHLSAYALSYEPGTPLERMLRSGDIKEVDDELAAQMYLHLCKRMEEEGYQHYEISNFARPGYRSRHNTAYWTGLPYIGLGAAAHSYDGSTRSWNPPLRDYLRGVPGGKEQLTERDRFNERVLTRLRTAEGLNLAALAADFGEQRMQALLKAAQPHLRAGRLLRRGGSIRLSLEALFISNGIIADLLEG